MRVLILSSAHPYRVAGSVALSLLKGFRQRGHDVKLLVKGHAGEVDHDIASLQKHYQAVLSKIHGKLLRRINRILPILPRTNADFSVQDFDETKMHFSTTQILNRARIAPEVILHLFPGGFLNAKNLYELNLATGAPIYWYLMDSAALTGGCHYSWDCMGYTRGCGSCPAMYSSDADDQSAKNFQFKSSYYSRTNMHVVCGSSWQYRMALQSPLFDADKVHKILLSTDPQVFHPGSKLAARQHLGLAPDASVLFFAATALGEKRKGMHYLSSALQAYKKSGAAGAENLQLLVAGNDFESIAGDLPFPTRHLGLISSDEELATAFQASDCFACPSIEDAGPMMINQALMCGRPVLAFEMGVAEDLVHRGTTGYRARLKDGDDLAYGLAELLSMNRDARGRYEQSCRDLALRRCSPQVHINAWESLFHQ